MRRRDGRFPPEVLRAGLTAGSLFLFALSSLWTDGLVASAWGFPRLSNAHFASVLLVLVAATLLGAVAARYLAERLSAVEQLGWSMALGVLVQVLSYAAVLLFGWPQAAWSLLGVALLMTAAVLLLRRRRVSESARPTLSVPTGILWGLSLAAVLLFTGAATRSPMVITDFVYIWGLKAKAIFSAGSIPDGLFHDPVLVYTHPEYPLLVPLLLSSTASAIGVWDPSALALLYPFFQLGTILVASGFVGRRISLLAGATTGLLVALCLPLYSTLNLGTAEIPLAFAFVLLATAFIDCLERQTVSSCARLVAAAVFCVGTKSEGSTFVLLLAATFFIQRFRHGQKAIAAPLLCLIFPVIVHGTVLLALRGPIPSRDSDFTLLSLPRFPDLIARLSTVIQRVASVEVPAIAVHLIALVVVVLLSRPAFADSLAPALVGQETLYLGACALSAFGPIWQIESALARVSATLLPVVLLVLVARVFPARP